MVLYAMSRRTPRSLEHCPDDDEESDGKHSPDEAECNHLLLQLLVHRMALEHVCIWE